ncbi:hypothetical protein JHK86_002354 [Glycine max]|nr:hypothetical protein JHK86_002354 [Glycine max]
MMKLSLKFQAENAAKGTHHHTQQPLSLRRHSHRLPQPTLPSSSTSNPNSLLKGMCFWMGRDLEIVEKENREMKRLLDEMKLGRNNRLEESKGGGRKLSESNGEVQRWRSYKSERQECNNQTNRKV